MNNYVVVNLYLKKNEFYNLIEINYIYITTLKTFS